MSRIITDRITPILLLIAAMITACGDGVSYLDPDYPDLIPKKYAVGIVNLEGRLQQNLTMSPDGVEHLFTITDSAIWRYESMLRVRRLRNEILVDTPQFVTDFEYENEWFIGEPMISPDNQSLYFVADYPPDLWHSQRTADGDWAAPTKMTEVSTEKDDWYVTFARNQNLYFTNGTVFKASLEEGEYSSKVKLDSPFNSKDTRDPCISPNEDYMIFAATDSLTANQSDLFISFVDADGNWTAAQNLGNIINTEYLEFAPYISPDERFLFFSRREKWQNAAFSNIYWVDLKVVEKFRSPVK
ncbi:MAG: PD40 domain-containing protein [Saprospiraceae bacterium]|nr:PD40 domain-containing protein [Saprospiraceae bacterium]